MKCMGNKYLYDALPFLKNVDRERQEQFEHYFETAPLWLMETFQIEEVDKGVAFIRENEPADTIYFIGKGVIDATDYRIYGSVYDYMRFKKVYAFGGMEFIMDLDVYKTTLRTATKCTLVKIPRTKFEKWMYSDIRALKNEAKCVGEYLLEQERNSRVTLFLQGADRLALLLSERYVQYNKEGVLQIDEGRQSLAYATGLCVKSVNRAVKKFMEDDLVTKKGNKILIDREQYEGLKKMISSKIALE